MYFGTLLFYLLLIFLVYVMTGRMADKMRGWLYFSYFLLAFVSTIRFDIGNDYNHYVYAINDIISWGNTSIFDLYTDVYLGRYEFSFLFIAKMFSFSSYPHIWVYGLYSIILWTIVYLVFEKEQLHHNGLLIFIVCGLMFWCWDGIRQGIAYVLLVYSYLFLREKKYLYFGLILLLATLFHNSSLFALPVLLLMKKSLSNGTAIGILIALLVLMWFGIFDTFTASVSDYFSLLSGYYESYANARGTLMAFTSITYKIRVSLYACFWTSIIIFLPSKEVLLKNLTLLGSVIYIIGEGSLVFVRIAWIFLAAIIIAYPIVLRDRAGSVKKLVLGALVLVFILFSRDIFTDTNVRGCVPYKTLFSNDAKNMIFEEDEE